MCDPFQAQALFLYRLAVGVAQRSPIAIAFACRLRQIVDSSGRIRTELTPI